MSGTGDEMASHPHLSEMDNLISTRGYFERILAERDRAEVERDKRLDERFAAQEKALDAALLERDKSLAAALAAAKEAVIKAEQNNEKKFDNANEWRGQSSDRERTQQEQLATFSRTLLPRETFESFLAGHSEFVQRIERFQSKAMGSIVVVVVVIPAITSVITYALTRH